MSNIEQEALKKKSRNQSAYEFFETLQVEWIVADLRIKVYPKIKDKDHWRKVCTGKKVTILDIAQRNQLPTIFDDSDLEQDLRKRVYRPESYPNFVYRDENNRLNQEYYDLLYYFNKGAEVRFDYFDEVKIGRIKDYRPFQKEILITFGEKEEKISTSKVTRIL